MYAYQSSPGEDNDEDLNANVNLRARQYDTDPFSLFDSNGVPSNDTIKNNFRSSASLFGNPARSNSVPVARKLLVTANGQPSLLAATNASGPLPAYSIDKDSCDSLQYKYQQSTHGYASNHYGSANEHSYGAYMAQGDGAIYNSDSAQSENTTKGWDVFAMTPAPDEDETLDSRWYQVFIRFLKLCAYIITFIVVLSSAFVSKSVMLFMSTLIKPNRTGIAICANGISGLDRDKRYEAIFHLNDPERVAWIWCLLFAVLVPEVMTLFRSVRICMFKSFSKPSAKVFMTVFIMETLHSIGIALLVFAVLPSLDVLSGAMFTNCFCVLPGLLALLSRHTEEHLRLPKMGLDVLALTGQLVGLAQFSLKSEEPRWLIPTCAILISCGWWENYADQRSSLGWIRKLGVMKQPLHKARYFTYAIVSSWKMIILTGGMFFIRYYKDGAALYLLQQMKSAFSQHKVLIARAGAGIGNIPENLEGVESEWLELDVFGNTPLWFLFVQICASWLCYVFGKFACKICMQKFSFALPLLLTVPLCMLALASGCELHVADSCSLSPWLPRHLFWACAANRVTLGSPHSLVWLLCLLSQAWICFHICRPTCERLATTEKLFVTPMYAAAFIDQSMMLNRRRDDRLTLKSAEQMPGERDDVRKEHDATHYETISDTPDIGAAKGIKGPVLEEDYTTRILVCATMWHETKEEMIQMLKSVFRMDEDQCAKKNAKQYINEKMQDYYEFEVHIFFDDAFEFAEETDDMVVNSFVKQFFTVLDEAASNVHQTEIFIKPPKKYPTPYGGRLEWILPGKNRLIAHLKDKLKIRHRKRWSQVMYMYYLLGHCLIEQPIEVSRKAVRAENTYILALDGDINFRPSAVQLLVDLMKKNRKLGAACGRIHPVGSGPMVWYQKFEYAIGHWLQKATEHMIGCVLCSPGCFSLFRAKALMDDNVMRKYTTKSDQALHYVQYDQGEDRWLCTLLLQRGYRVEYSAASDAYTHCPEGFGEFYTQRRRWAPSTMANILDLLGDYKRTVAINDNISFPYIVYQGMLMVGTILGPGTIFLMLVGALVAVFRISNWYSFQLNLFPILLFMLICFTMKNDFQILAAQILSTCYVLLMMAVFVGTSIQMVEDGISSPSAMFFIALTGTFFVAALLHPQEFYCVVPIILYFLSIPCMYLLLIIYSLINLHVVTWGTREIAPRLKPSAQQRKPQAPQAKKKGRLLEYFNADKDEEEDGGIVISLANLFKCMFFTHTKPDRMAGHLQNIQENLVDIRKQVNVLERTMTTHRRRAPSSLAGRRPLDTVNENAEMGDDGVSIDSMRIREEDDLTDIEDDELSMNSSPPRDDMVNPFWIEDPHLQDGPVCALPPGEITFFKELISKYLHPLDENKQEQAKIAADLIELRNRVVFSFVMLNALFILIVFLLQLNKDILHVEWPFGVRENVTFIPETNEIRVEKQYLQMEPIGLVFVLFFGIILIIQFVGMMFHRFATLSHILASVELFSSSKKLSIEDELNGNAAALARHFQKLKGINDDDRESLQKDLGGRNIVERCEERKHARKEKISTLDVAFRKRFEEFTKQAAAAAAASNTNGNAGRSEPPSTPILGIYKQETLNALRRKGDTLLNGDAFVRANRVRETLDKKKSIGSRSARNDFNDTETGHVNSAFSANEEHTDDIRPEVIPRTRFRRSELTQIEPSTSSTENVPMNSFVRSSSGSMMSLDQPDVRSSDQQRM